MRLSSKDNFPFRAGNRRSLQSRDKGGRGIYAAILVNPIRSNEMGAYWSTLAATFLAVFVAELGDKTQLAALGLSSATRHPWAVFLGSAFALVASSALAVGLGRFLAARLDLRWLHYGGAALFLSIGLYMLIRGPAR